MPKVEQQPPVPAVPSLVLGLGNSLQHKLAWLERRFRTEIGSLYPGSLLRFRALAKAEELAPQALHALCDPLLVHPLWLGLVERGLAPRGEHGPQLNVYAIVTQEDARGAHLLAPLHTALKELYNDQITPGLRVFFVGTDPAALPALAEATRPVPCFVLGPVKQFGYRTQGRQEPFEAIRLALNALLASSAGAEIEGLLQPDRAPGLVTFALGASAIAVARPQMETWLRNTLLRRLAQACLAEDEPGEGRAARHLQARREVAEVFGLAEDAPAGDGPDELWEKRLGRGIVGLFPRWANDLLQAWGLELLETRRGHWRLKARSEGDLHRHLQQVLSELSELQEDARVVLTQDIVRLAHGLRRHFERQEQAILDRWQAVPQRAMAAGPGCLARCGEIVAAAEAGLNRARDVLQMQHHSPVWLRGEGDILALADILAAKMVPVRSAAERARASFAPPGRVALRLAPLVLLLGGVGADLRPGWQGLGAGLGGGLAFMTLLAGLQYRRLRRETYVGVCELCRLYEDAVGGVLVSEARNVLRHLQEAVGVSAAQLRAVEGELKTLDAEAARALEELVRFPRENTYLERQLSDPAHCAQLAEEVPLERLLGEGAPGDGEAPSPGGVLAAAAQGTFPARALGAALVEAVGHLVARGSGAMIETRVEEMLVGGAGQPFSPEGTMDSLHQRALPLWPAEQAEGQEVALAVLSREAAMAFQGWLQAHAGAVRLLPTLQRDRISYLRCRRLAPGEAA